MKNSLLLIINKYAVKENPFIISDMTVQKPNNYSNQKNTNNNYYIQRKSLTNYLDVKSVQGLKIYYGTVNLKWYRNPKDIYYPHRLCIYNLQEKFLICSLMFTEKSYLYLDIKYKENEFRASVAFFTELKPNVFTDKTYFNGKISDSRKIVFFKSN